MVNKHTGYQATTHSGMQAMRDCMEGGDVGGPDLRALVCPADAVFSAAPTEPLRGPHCCG